MDKKKVKTLKRAGDITKILGGKPARTGNNERIWVNCIKGSVLQHNPFLEPEIDINSTQFVELSLDAHIYLYTNVEIYIWLPK